MRKLVNGYVLVSLLLVLDVSLYVGWRISLAGYWSDRVLFWIWLVFTAVVLKRGWNRRATKIYAGLLVALLVLSMVPMMINFSTIVMVGFGLDRDYAKDIEGRIIIQQTGKSIMSVPTLEVIEKKGIYERQIGSMNATELWDEEETHPLPDLVTLHVRRQTKDSIQVELVFKKGNLTLWMQNE
jgi:hypothetical protein